jgi:hypothetical protein
MRQTYKILHKTQESKEILGLICQVTERGGTRQPADPWNIKPQGAHLNVAKFSSLKSSDYYMEPSSVGDPDGSGDVYLQSNCFQKDVLHQFFEYLSRIWFKPDRIPNTGTKYPLKSME